jgi:hypothetical protein
MLRQSFTLGSVAAASGALADVVRDLVVKDLRGQGCVMSQLGPSWFSCPWA